MAIKKSSKKSIDRRSGIRWPFRLFPTVIVTWMLILTAVIGYGIWCFLDYSLNYQKADSGTTFGLLVDNSAQLQYQQPLISVEKKQLVFPMAKLAMKLDVTTPPVVYSYFNDGDNEELLLTTRTRVHEATSVLANLDTHAANPNQDIVSCESYVALRTQKDSSQKVVDSVKLADGRVFYLQSEEASNCDNGWNRQVHDTFVNLAKTAVPFNL